MSETNEEKMYTPSELAEKWKLSVATIRNWFRSEDGVLKFGTEHSRPGKGRAHMTLRIPADVAERVRVRMSS